MNCEKLCSSSHQSLVTFAEVEAHKIVHRAVEENRTGHGGNAYLAYQPSAEGEVVGKSATRNIDEDEIRTLGPCKGQAKLVKIAEEQIPAPRVILS
jgi:hypothetical protein